LKKLGEILEIVNPKSSLVGKIYPDDKPLAPRKINFSNYGFEKDDYIGLAKIGEYYYKSPELLTSESLHVKFGSDPSFELSKSQEIFRLVKGIEAKFAPNDVYFKDNSFTKNKFGVIISFVNNPSPKKNLADYEKANIYFQELVIGHSSKFTAEGDLILPNFIRKSAAPLFKEEIKGKYRYQYRGWYENDTWAPEYSKYKGRPGKKHGGIDIFAPIGTTIVSPVDGFFEPGVGADFGNFGLIAFNHEEKKKFLFLCHLSKLVLTKSQWVTAGTVIGYAGCSGNAQNNLPCGSAKDRNRYGGRSDHIHIEVRVGGPADKNPTEDPVRIFNWAGLIKYA
jgi:murein DD-endopeptidase MepM/ murein hydrolase activator NlpD